MLLRESDHGFEVNWVAILSFTTSAALSVAIWTGIFRLVAHLLEVSGASFLAGLVGVVQQGKNVVPGQSFSAF